MFLGKEFTMKSETEFRFYINAVIKSRYLFFVVSCMCLLCGVLGENLRNYGLIASGLNPDWRTDFGRIISWMLIPGALLFPIGICFSTRKWLLSEKWLLLFLESAVISMFFSFGFQNPYVDSPFYNRPILEFLNDFCALSCFAAVLQGIPIVILHFFPGEKNNIPMWRRFFSTVSAVLLTVLVLVFTFSFTGKNF